MSVSRPAVGYLRVDMRIPAIGEARTRHETGALLRIVAARRFTLLGLFVDRLGPKREPMVELAKALEACRDDAVLIFPGLGRLARDPSLYERLEESGVDFIALDYPNLTPETLTEFGLMAYRADPRAAAERRSLAQGLSNPQPGQTLGPQARRSRTTTAKP